MSKSQWTYEEVTTAVEEEIKLQLREAELTMSEVTRNTYRHYAFGAYLAWEAVTRTCLTERRFADARRLGDVVGFPDSERP
ncbi:hypothetical protein J8I87_37670 [Paraburkholderia sp. LEh10]|jgi:hypothetical protein|uniref:hypothetical protein n=1 Tax=Paraburkholderia sp. LEh10 TaxID=2821353 RepID=UPI001AE9BC24|nr:hypothetical protein [Paraburkholderia sp. LEh10]MBP0595283.1 hypothetical protein [Paraburkholderia sp. LEh10]